MVVMAPMAAYLRPNSLGWADRPNTDLNEPESKTIYVLLKIIVDMSDGQLPGGDIS